jgi:AraC family transcriptional regulator
MEYLQQVQQGIDFIEEHLGEDIALGDVSRVAGVSHWHFLRMFKALTNETLKSYIRSRRLANARRSLQESQDSILMIALAAGFESQAAFTRAFKRAFGVTPARYRHLGDQHFFLEKARIDADYLRHIHHGVSMEPELKEMPAQVMVGMPTYFYDVGSERNNIGEKLPSLWAEFMSRFDEVEGKLPGVACGVIRQAESSSEQLQYVAAAHVQSGGHPVPRGMVELEIPGATYAVFEHEGLPKDIDLTVSYVYSTWLMRSGMRHTYGPDLEIYDERYQPDSPNSIVLYAIPVRPA